MERERWFKIFNYCLHYGGVDPFPKRESKFKIKLLYIIQVLTLIWFFLTFLSVILFVFFNIHSIDLATTAAVTSPVPMLGSLKLYIFFINQKEIVEMSDALILKDFARQLPIVDYVLNEDVQGKKLLELRLMVLESKDFLIRSWTMAFKIYFIVILCTVQYYHILPFLLSYLYPDEYQRLLPYKMVFPWNEKESPAYEITYLIELQCGFFCVTSFPGLDSLLLYLIGHILRQLQVLTFVMEHLGQLVGEVSEEGSEQWERDCTTALAHCVRHYVKLRTLVKRLNIIHRYFFLAQVLTSSVLLCLCTFKIATMPPFTIDSMLYYLLEVSSLLQISVTCWPGQLLINQSEKMELTVLEGWYHHGRGYRTDVAVFYSMLQRPLTMYVWGSLDLSLFTLSAVVRTSMSYFAMMKSLAEE